MSRFFVPLVFVGVISGLAFGLVVGIIGRSPETHANVRPEGFDRTPITYVGEESPFAGIGLADPWLVTDVDQAARGRLLFLSNSCATCHGLGGQGGVVGPALDPGELTPSEFRRNVRSGPKGMPAFMEEVISNDDLEAIYAFLEATRQGASITPDGSTSTP